MDLIERMNRCVANASLGPNNSSNYEALFDLCSEVDLHLKEREEYLALKRYKMSRGRLGERYQVESCELPYKEILYRVFDFETKVEYEVYGKRNFLGFGKAKAERYQVFTNVNFDFIDKRFKEFVNKKAVKKSQTLKTR